MATTASPCGPPAAGAGATTPGSNAIPEESESLSKKARGRLKKLLKRANSVDSNKDASGLVEPSDWVELRELLDLAHPSPDPTQQKQVQRERIVQGPRISWRRGKEQVVEASDHRDILFRFVWPRKRKLTRGDDDGEPDDWRACAPRLPSWASVHNPAQVEQAAVLELHCATDSQFRTLQATLDGLEGCLGVPTRWFVGLHHPKSATQALLYAAPPKPRKSAEDPTRLTSLQEVHAAIASLALSEATMKAEGYPCGFLAASDEEDPAATDQAQRIDAASRQVELQDDGGGDALLFIPELELAQVRVNGALVPVVANAGDGKVRSYVCTKSRSRTDSPAPPRVLGLDCEMVETTLGRELARVTLVELTGFEPLVSTRVRMDRLVQPRGAVVDYLTAFSGITADLLRSGPTADLVQVQAALLDFVTPCDVLVGHSLENDLHALQWVHPMVVDTALLLRADGAKYKHSLRHLASNLLQKAIQQASHCSCEDAGTALELAVHRVVRGPSFARHLMRAQPTNQLVALSCHGPVVCLGSPEWLRQHAETRSSIHALRCDSVTHPNHKAVASWLTTANPLRRAKLVVGSWTLSGEPDTDDDNDAPVREVLTLISALRSQLDSSTMVCVALQRGLHQTVRLTEERKARMNPKASMAWTDKEQDEWTQMITDCRNGKVYWMAGNKGTARQDGNE